MDFPTPPGADPDASPPAPTPDQRRARADARVARERRLFVTVFVVATVAVLVALLFTVGPFRHRGPGAPPFTGKLNPPLNGRAYRVTAWTTSDAPSLAVALKAQAIDEVDFDWYMSQADGSVTAANENLALVDSARRQGVQAFATVTNRATDKSAFDGKIATAILATPESRRRAINGLVNLALDKGFDGIDLDWEMLTAADRDNFSMFVEQLAAELHIHHRLLSIAVFGKTSEPGLWDTQKSADYHRLGNAVDEFKIMTYSYSGPWGDPGPQAPLDWTSKVLGFAETQMPPGRIFMGLPFYGFDWHGGTATAVHSNDAAALIARYHLKVGHDPASGEADLSFTDAAGVDHVLWFQDRQSIATKLDLLRSAHPHIGGISIWEMRDEDPGFWTVIGKKLK